MKFWWWIARRSASGEVLSSLTFNLVAVGWAKGNAMARKNTEYSFNLPLLAFSLQKLGFLIFLLTVFFDFPIWLEVEDFLE